MSFGSCRHFTRSQKSGIMTAGVRIVVKKERMDIFSLYVGCRGAREESERTFFPDFIIMILV